MKLIYSIWNSLPHSFQSILKYCIFFRKYSFKQIQSLSLTDLFRWNYIISPSSKIGVKSFVSWKFEIWDYSYLFWNNVISASDTYSIKIWKFCSIASEVMMMSSSDHDYTKITTYPLQLIDKQFVPPLLGWNIVIWNDVWIWLRAIILPGVTIWTWAVIWAWSIVTKDIPPYAIAVWSPAKVIKYRFDDSTIDKLLTSKWLNWDIKKILNNYHLPVSNNI